jgi:polyhydroxybutyrate depolymerase
MERDDSQVVEMSMAVIRTLGATLMISFAGCANNDAPEQVKGPSSVAPATSGAGVTAMQSEPRNVGGANASGRAGAMAVNGAPEVAGSGAGSTAQDRLPRGGAGATGPEAPDAPLAGAPARDGAMHGDAGSAGAASGAAAGAGGVDAGGTVACPSGALGPGDERGSLEHGGMTRSIIVHVPSGYDNTRPIPLVLNFHGATMTAALQQQTTGMNAKADEAGFVVVYPEGVDRSWNAGACCRGAAQMDIDDVGFARALVEYTRGRVCVDPKRIYATGFSNGGRMSYRLGCEAADLFAAIAPVAGTKSFPDLQNSPGCTPKRPIPLLDIMGSADSRIEAQPGQIAEWVAFNGCKDAEAEMTYQEGRHVCYSYKQCTAGALVSYCIVDGLGHAWPRNGFVANDRIWEFFQGFTL